MDLSTIILKTLFDDLLHRHTYHCEHWDRRERRFNAFNRRTYETGFKIVSHAKDVSEDCAVFATLEDVHILLQMGADISKDRGRDSFLMFVCQVGMERARHSIYERVIYQKLIKLLQCHRSVFVGTAAASARSTYSTACDARGAD